jgi:hypothetical protein
MRDMQKVLVKYLTNMIGETNGVSLIDTLNLLLNSDLNKKHPEVNNEIKEFRELLDLFRTNKIQISKLLEHSFSNALFDFFKNFPLKYREEHIHLTGSLTGEFIFPRLKVLLEGPNKKIYKERIKQVYGPMSLPITSPEDIDKLIRLKENEGFSTYLKILYLPQLIFINKQVHIDAAYHMANELFHKYNVGHIRLNSRYRDRRPVPRNKSRVLVRLALKTLCLVCTRVFQDLRNRILTSRSRCHHHFAKKIIISIKINLTLVANISCSK